LEFGNVSFGAGARGNPENLERNLSEQGEEPTTNSSHL